MVNNMENINFEQPEIKKEKVEKIKIPIEEQLVDFFAEVFNNNDSEQRLEDLLWRVQKFLIVADDNRLDQNMIDEIKNGLKKISTINDKQDFIEQGLKVLSPLITWYNEDKKTFEAKLRENVVAARGFIPLNEMLTYGRDENYVHILVSPSETMNTSEKLFLVKDGFRKLADILKKDDSIKEIVAQSWIVAANPGLLKNFGFDIIEEVEKNDENKHLPDRRPIATAIASKESFLEAMEKYK